MITTAGNKPTVLHTHTHTHTHRELHFGLRTWAGQSYRFYGSSDTWMIVCLIATKFEPFYVFHVGLCFYLCFKDSHCH